MEQKVYVASGRFIIEAGKPPVVEYVKIPQLFPQLSWRLCHSLLKYSGPTDTDAKLFQIQD